LLLKSSLLVGEEKVMCLMQANPQGVKLPEITDRDMMAFEMWTLPNESPDKKRRCRFAVRRITEVT